MVFCNQNCMPVENVNTNTGMSLCCFPAEPCHVAPGEGSPIPQYQTILVIMGEKNKKKKTGKCSLNPSLYVVGILLLF